VIERLLKRILASHIDELSPEQYARLPEFRDTWQRIALSCDPADFEAARKAVSYAYRKALLPIPTRWYYCQSPQGLWTIAPEFRGRSRDERWAKQVGQAMSCGITRLAPLVYSEVLRGLRIESAAELRLFINEQVFEQFGREYLRKIDTRDFAVDHESSTAFFDFAGEVLGLRSCKRLKPMLQIAKHCGACAGFGDAVILQDRPCELHLDDEGHLHNDSGMAIKYRDGWGIYAIHGVRVPGQREGSQSPTADR
jgi:hypothetical protein